MFLLLCKNWQVRGHILFDLLTKFGMINHVVRFIFSFECKKRGTGKKAH